MKLLQYYAIAKDIQNEVPDVSSLYLPVIEQYNH